MRCVAVRGAAAPRTTASARRAARPAAPAPDLTERRGRHRAGPHAPPQRGRVRAARDRGRRGRGRLRRDLDLPLGAPRRGRRRTRGRGRARRGTERRARRSSMRPAGATAAREAVAAGAVDGTAGAALPSCTFVCATCRGEHDRRRLDRRQPRLLARRDRDARPAHRGRLVGGRAGRRRAADAGRGVPPTPRPRDHPLAGRRRAPSHAAHTLRFRPRRPGGWSLCTDGLWNYAPDAHGAGRARRGRRRRAARPGAVARRSRPTRAGRAAGATTSPSPCID